ncbi:hypothetical protein P4654_26100, partial [Niallia taxi]|nr:hypothetical protein [Niallia taxi]
GGRNSKHTKISSTGREIGLDYYFLYSRSEEQAGAFLGSGIRILNWPASLTLFESGLSMLDPLRSCIRNGNQ